MSSGTLTPRHDGAFEGDEKTSNDALEKENVDHSPVRLLTFRVFFMGIIVSIGGLIFGYDTGQISGILEMKNFLERFHSGQHPPGSPEYVQRTDGYYFDDARSGTIVALLSIGTLIGALSSAPIADVFGRKICIIVWNIVFCIGVVIQMATEHAWYQVAIGRLVAGFGVGGLSVLTPMYQSETAPRQIRGAMVSTYQLFITLGIFISNCIDFGTYKIDSAASWRIVMGIGFVFPLIMITGILFLPESPRWAYRHDKIEQARETISKSYGVPINHFEVRREMREIKEKFDAENAGGGKHKFYEVITGPRMAYRVGLGVTLQALQQLTGANFFFYYGTTIFQGVAIDSYVTAMVLGGVNFAMTFPGLWVVEHLGRRKALISGAAWMFGCFMVFASVGHFSLDQNTPTNTPGASKAMIVFACLFIAGYAMTWGPIVWAVVGEMFPTRYRAAAMGISSASNWTWNFLISFFSPFITKAIDFRYGYVFAACNFAAVFIVYFFLCEHRGRTLEEIDTMYITHVPPTKSSSWQPTENEELATTDALHLEPGARGIRKANAAGMETDEKRETIPEPTANSGIHDVSHTYHDLHASGVRGNSVS